MTHCTNLKRRAISSPKNASVLISFERGNQYDNDVDARGTVSPWFDWVSGNRFQTESTQFQSFKRLSKSEMIESQFWSFPWEALHPRVVTIKTRAASSRKPWRIVAPQPSSPLRSRERRK